MRLFFYKILKKLIFILGLERQAYLGAEKYVHEYGAEDNGDMQTNGEFRLLEKNSRLFGVVFDVGANLGDWSSRFISLKSKQEDDNFQIHCFEPAPETFCLLKSKNFPKNVFLNNFGLCDATGKRSMFILGAESGGHSFYRNFEGDSWNPSVNKKYGTKREIFVETLDYYCSTRGIASIDFLKVDTEGAEVAVLLGARNLIKNSAIAVIQFEYNGCWIEAKRFLKDVFDAFEGLPYAFYKIFPNELKRIDYYDQRLENFHYCNYLIVRNGFPLVR